MALGQRVSIEWSQSVLGRGVRDEENEKKPEKQDVSQ